MKIFSEIYNTYFEITEKILKRKIVTKADIMEIIRQNGFSETMLFLEPKLTGDDGYGLLIHENGAYRSILKKEPHTPLTTLEKSWLCAVLNDRKSGLFLDTAQKEQLMEILGIQPLFSQNMICFFDMFTDGDNFEDPQYIDHFRKILTAKQNHSLINISFQSMKGGRITHYFLPVRIEFSAKNNRFRIHVIKYKKNMTPLDSGIINLSNVTETVPTNVTIEDFAYNMSKKEVTVEVIEERNSINRFMMEFAELERTSEFDEDSGRCTVKMKYSGRDEAEILIRLLSFGPTVKVLEPPELRQKLKERIDTQSALFRNLHA
ncbi:MAG: WYL domain-containing protein [Ruminococcus sp.]|nr:WYL domain-containing protein [Ruminococcus sp.]